MATEPMTSGLFAGLVAKLGLMGAVAAIGGFIISLFDKAETKRERALQATCAGAAGIIFGKAATRLTAGFLTSVPFDDLLLPVCFLVGALSWGAFGALANLRRQVAAKGADAVADKVGLK